ncbi:hypothetical protein JRQ81_018642 [Phrynocephalus forsythii]|uniref:Retinoic acid receptor responder protein 2 n=1 Tax=Phrynocephalus forsythii TaxID=171643 RepID=A0A9Q1AZ91_9SAUR|nr:hypothetical protein JRQ81_018642 [Phrynocephalus forsythii]
MPLLWRNIPSTATCFKEAFQCRNTQEKQPKETRLAKAFFAEGCVCVLCVHVEGRETTPPLFLSQQPFAPLSLSWLGHKRVNSSRGWRGQPGQLSGEGVNDQPRSTEAERGFQAEGSGRSRPTKEEEEEQDTGHWRMRSLLALGLALLALLDGSRSSPQDKAVSIVLEFFHGRSFVQYLFKEQPVATADTQEFPMGIYINLEVELYQTVCRKNQQRAENCPIKAGGRRQTCLACFKVDSNNPDHVLDRAIHCLAPHSRNFQHTKNTHEQECEDVKKANEQLYLPGKFAFSRGRPL